ncbi:SAG1386/EF1546 family surface-associated protein [Streptococcus halichoeri]|uniref:SAG1386/EF1546 family surface-associated protein n=1 Tax=Streptococcus halichoeri TaxID=254785 RepID=UPI001356A155|nr:SAG1386/EF1546 family surface-associated protein [Streptococcus halichoeri]
MAKEPWEEKIVNDQAETRSKKHAKTVLSTPWLTGLLSVFFVIIVAILFVFFYTSNSGGNKDSETGGFYGAQTSKTATKHTSRHRSRRHASKKAKPKASKASSTKTSSSKAKETQPSSTAPSSSSEQKGQTIQVLPGEGVAAIAGRAGISVSQLQQLNPDHMTQGYWYANPGDSVYIN